MGSALINRLKRDKIEIRCAVRRDLAALTQGVDYVFTGDLSPEQNWNSALKGIDCVIHLAARVHVMKDGAIDPMDEYRRINVDATLNLAQQSIKSGVRRFIFISSIKVNGESSETGHPFSCDDHPDPQDAYGISKYEAEIGLRQLAENTGMEVVIIRPPLVYGPGVKANFLSIMKLIHLGIPIPLGAVQNKRSFIALDNFVDIIAHCIYHSEVANKTFLVSDGEDLSTTQLLIKLGAAFGKQAKLIPVPVSFMDKVARLLHREADAQRLFGSLQIDGSKIVDVLEWRPVVTIDEALLKTVTAFLASRKNKG